jgi:hypothetical protein
LMLGVMVLFRYLLLVDMVLYVVVVLKLMMIVGFLYRSNVLIALVMRSVLIFLGFL